MDTFNFTNDINEAKKIAGNNQLLPIQEEQWKQQLQKKKEIAIEISADDISNREVYYNKLLSCKAKVRYSIIIRLCYLNESYKSVTDWKTLGVQISFEFTDINMLYGECKNIIDIIIERLEFALSHYHIKYSNVLAIQLLVFRVSFNEVIAKKVEFNTFSLKEHKDLISLSKVKKEFNLLPLSRNLNDFGVKLLKTVIDGYVQNITLIDGEKIDFNNLVNKYSSNIIKLGKDIDFYQLNTKDKTYITTITSQAQPTSSAQQTSQTQDEKVIRVYTKAGIKICQMTDQVIDDHSFKRKIGNITAYVDKNGVFNKEIDQDFKAIKPRHVRNSQSKLFAYSDYKIGTLDLETYNISAGASRTYAIGFHTKDDTNLFYIDESLNSCASDELIKKCLNSMLKEKYNGYTFYVHNLGGFDAPFLLKILEDLVEKHPDVYRYEAIRRDSKILCLNISKSNVDFLGKQGKGSSTIKPRSRKTKTYSIKIVDSYNILQAKLDKLCRTFNPSVVKTFFPYEFVKKNTLFYEGNKPDSCYYNNITIEDYDKIVSSPCEAWKTKQETLKYLSNDLQSLFIIMEKFSKYIWLHYDVQVTSSYTISGIAMQIFLKKFYNNNIPLINKKSVHSDIRKSYYGGNTEVYIPYGKNLYYYDVNSLYPYSAFNDMPGLNCIYIENINKNISQLFNELFGFYYCRIVTSNLTIGLLPVRKENGSIYMPEGKLEGWYFSEELKFAYKHGYHIHIIKGYKFDRCKDVFKSYIEHFYKVKANAKDDVIREISKALLNHLLGRFGMDLDKPITEIVTYDDLQNILQTRKIIGDVKHIGAKYLVTFHAAISQEICEKHNVDYKQTLINQIMNAQDKFFKEESLNNVSVCISSAVTSYSRMYMSEAKLNILSKGGKIYYTDTDSIVTDIPLNEELVGTHIGQFKLEHKIEEGYFISNKTYCLKDSNGKITIKNKGVDNNDIDNEKDTKKREEKQEEKLKQFKSLYFDRLDIQTDRNEAIKNYSEGYTRINRTPVTITSDSYTKRLKVYHKNLWVDTKPLNVNMWEQSKKKGISYWC